MRPFGSFLRASRRRGGFWPSDSTLPLEGALGLAGVVAIGLLAKRIIPKI